MISEPPLPADLKALFPEGDPTHRTLSVPLPPGRGVASDEGPGDRPVLWLSDGPVAAGSWARLRTEHARSQLWPLLLGALDDDDADFRPWGDGDLHPEDLSDPELHDPAALLSRWWERCSSDSADTAPYGRAWPGPAPRPALQVDPDHAGDDLADALLAARGSMRLGLVAARRGADALTAAGWQGPLNHTNDTAEISAVVRDWEDRFGVRVVGVEFATLHLSVAAPPATHEEALPVAAEHFAFCPDNIWQGRAPCTLAAYAEGLVGARSWSFWWD